MKLPNSMGAVLTAIAAVALISSVLSAKSAGTTAATLGQDVGKLFGQAEGKA